VNLGYIGYDKYYYIRLEEEGDLLKSKKCILVKDSTVFDNENKEPFVWAKNYSITSD
jgi:hypothetical protein